MIGPGIFLVTLIVAAAITLFYLVRTKHIETMAKIEHGMLREDKFASARRMLNLGVFFISIGGGIITGYFISVSTDIPDYISIPSCLFLFGGVSLIFNFLVTIRWRK